MIPRLPPGLLSSELGQQARQSPGGIRPLGKERQREDGGFPQLIVRALGLDLEAAQALDLAAEEVETQRFFVASGEEVEDSAAHREVADFADEIDAAVAERRQPEGELVEVDLVAAARAGSASSRRLRAVAERERAA